MKRKLMISAFFALVMLTAFSMFWAARVDRSFGSPSRIKSCSVGVVDGIVTLYASDSYGTWSAPNFGVHWWVWVWDSGITREHARSDMHLRTGGLYYQWAHIGMDRTGWVDIPLWIPIAILAVMIFRGRRRVPRSRGFPVGVKA